MSVSHITQGRQRTPGSRLDRHHARHVFARHARHAGGGRRQDRCGTEGGTGGL